MPTKSSQTKRSAPQAPANDEDAPTHQDATPEPPEAVSPPPISDGRHAPHHQKGV